MSTEELLKPRYKQINDWPFMLDRYKVGTIYTYENEFTAGMICNFPHLFQRMKWWEEREENDMPKYLKFKTNGKVRKVEHFNLFIDQIVFEGGRTRRLNKDWTPATESEYNECLKQLKK